MRIPYAVLILSALASASTAQVLDRTVTFLAAADTTVRADLSVRKNDNYGLDGTLLVGGTRDASAPPDAIRSLIRFDVSRLGKPVSRAVLRLDIHSVGTQVPSPAFNITVHRLLSAWSEGNGAEDTASPVLEAQGTDSASGVAWSGADQGGDANNTSQPAFSPSAYATMAIQGGAAGQTVECDITSLVNGWITGAVPNHGIVLRDTSLTSFVEIRFASKEITYYEGPAYRLHPPRLLLSGVSMEVTPPPSGVTASTHDGNVPGNTVDDNLGTRWSANGNGAWIKYDLGTVRTVSSVKLAVYAGNARQNIFDLDVSTDGMSWTRVIPNVNDTGKTSGTTTLEELHDFDDTPARYVRYTGHGNTVNTFNSVTELSIFALP